MADASEGLMDAKAIEYELFRLQTHSCDAHITIHSDPRIQPDYKPCSGCSRMWDLRDMLAAAPSPDAIEGGE